MAGDSETGVLIMRLTAGLDRPRLSQRARGDPRRRHLRLAVGAPGGAERSTAARRARPSSAGHRAAARRAGRARGDVRREDRLRGSPAGSGEDGVELERVVRALSPHIGARVALPDGVLLGVREATVFDSPSLSQDSGPAGASSGEESSPRLIEHDGRLLLACREGTALELRRVQPPGGRPMDASSYLRGRTARPAGDRRCPGDGMPALISGSGCGGPGAVS